MTVERKAERGLGICDQDSSLDWPGTGWMHVDKQLSHPGAHVLIVQLTLGPIELQHFFLGLK